jgi:hypothetical protein
VWNPGKIAGLEKLFGWGRVIAQWQFEGGDASGKSDKCGKCGKPLDAHWLACHPTTIVIIPH